jgi:hypothetical protein
MKSTMTTASPDPLRVVKETTSKRRGRRKAAAVSWYGRLLIFSVLLVAAGWEIFRLILAIITLD